MPAYSQEFYANRHTNTIYSANTILTLLFERIPTAHSAIDIGCGVGTWLSVLQEKGAKDIQGVDGSWVDEELLVIPRSCFQQVDLSRSVMKLPRKYDLAISLEVAEHLPSDRAREFVSSLTALSDYVLFSAAIPFQGGVRHINEQWQHYWAELFGDMDYVVHDFIRPRIWNDTRIPVWYRQNILLFSKRQESNGTLLDPVDLGDCSLPLDVVHPDLYLAKGPQLGLKSSLMLFLRSLKSGITRTLGMGS